MIPLAAALALARVPAAVRGVVMLIAGLAPELRDAVATLVRALQGGDDDETRRAYEAAKRAAFAARQR